MATLTNLHTDVGLSESHITKLEFPPPTTLRRPMSQKKQSHVAAATITTENDS